MSKSEVQQFRDEVAALTNKHPKWTVKELAKVLNASISRVRGALKKNALLPNTTVGEEQEKTEEVPDIKADLQIQKLRRRLRTSETLYRQACVTLENTQERLDTWEMFKGIEDMLVTEPISYKKSPKKHDALPVLVASDWHVDEVVKGDSISDVNAYDLEVSQKRIRQFFIYAAKILKMQANESDIDTLLIAALGDYMSAWLHDELIQTNSMTPMEVILHLLESWIGGLNYLLDCGAVQKILFVGACGNHGRITKRVQFKDRHKTSYEWLLYNLLMRHYLTCGETRIKFQMPTGYFNWVTVFGKPIRMHHGDNIRYQGGVGGVHIPVRKAIAQWNKTRRAWLDVFGHWHTLEWAQDYVINGSIIGYSAYAENLKADFQPAQQCLFVIHSRFGKTAQYPIVLQEMQAD